MEIDKEFSSTISTDMSQSSEHCWAELVSSLNAVKSLESFTCMKTYRSAVNPVIQVNEDLVTLPLTDHGAEIIKQADRHAHVGDGTQAAMDISNDGVWKLDTKNFSLLHPDWPSFLETVLDDVCKDFGITESVDAQLYELLLCEQDGLSQCQNETGETTGMIAMLTIYLPSAHQGGVIRLSHAEQDQTFDLSELSMFATRVLAWSPTATYEAEKITLGRCLILNYSITDKSATLKSPSSGSRQTETVTQALRQCVQQDPNFSTKIYMLDHKYPRAELLFKKLKGHDYAVCQTLKESCSLQGLYLLLGRPKMQRTTLDVDKDVNEDINECILHVDILDGESGLEMAKRVVFTGGQLLWDPDRIGSSALETVAILCPRVHLASYIDPSRSSNLENIIQVVMQDIEDRSDTYGYPGDSLGVLEEIVDSWHGSNLPSSIRAAVMQWAWNKQYQSLFIKILSSEMDLRVDVDTMNAVAQIINADILQDAVIINVPWHKYFVGVIRPTQNLKNVTLSLEAIESKILDDRKPSFKVWRSTVEQHMFRNNTSLKWGDILFFLQSIVPADERLHWVLNCVYHSGNEYLHIANTIILCTYPKVALEVTDFQVERFCSSPASLFANILRASLSVGLRVAAIRLLDASWTNIAPHHASIDTSPLMEHKVIIRDFLNCLVSILRFYQFPYISSTREIFKLLVRRYMYAAPPSYPKKLPGWTHKSRGCGCKICLEVDKFLESEESSKGEFIVEDIEHLKSRLPRGVIKCVNRPNKRLNIPSLVYRLYKLKDKEFEQDVESYNKQVSAFEKDFKMLRNEYMEGLFGEADYRELVMLEKLQNSEGQQQLAAAVDGKKRKAGENLFNGTGPTRKRKTKSHWLSSSEDDAY
ncbi:hypothetical protein EV127DRAFT_491236 [Xylaria flabelliformis]|nr:hypothetical protein EV127DRAFT_491236 [Xylaria flabelliformis]